MAKSFDWTQTHVALDSSTEELACKLTPADRVRLSVESGKAQMRIRQLDNREAKIKTRIKALRERVESRRDELLDAQAAGTERRPVDVVHVYRPAEGWVYRVRMDTGVLLKSWKASREEMEQAEQGAPVEAMVNTRATLPLFESVPAPAAEEVELSASEVAALSGASGPARVATRVLAEEDTEEEEGAPDEEAGVEAELEDLTTTAERERAAGERDADFQPVPPPLQPGPDGLLPGERIRCQDCPHPPHPGEKCPHKRTRGSCKCDKREAAASEPAAQAPEGGPSKVERQALSMAAVPGMEAGVGVDDVAVVLYPREDDGRAQAQKLLRGLKLSGLLHNAGGRYKLTRKGREALEQPEASGEQAKPEPATTSRLRDVPAGCDGCGETFKAEELQPLGPEDARGYYCAGCRSEVDELEARPEQEGARAAPQLDDPFTTPAEDGPLDASFEAVDFETLHPALGQPQPGYQRKYLVTAAGNSPRACEACGTRERPRAFLTFDYEDRKGKRGAYTGGGGFALALCVQDCTLEGVERAFDNRRQKVTDELAARDTPEAPAEEPPAKSGRALLSDGALWWKISDGLEVEVSEPATAGARLWILAKGEGDAGPFIMDTETGALTVMTAPEADASTVAWRTSASGRVLCARVARFLEDSEPARAALAHAVAPERVDAQEEPTGPGGRSLHWTGVPGFHEVSRGGWTLRELGHWPKMGSLWALYDLANAYRKETLGLQGSAGPYKLEGAVLSPHLMAEPHEARWRMMPEKGEGMRFLPYLDVPREVLEAAGRKARELLQEDDHEPGVGQDSRPRMALPGMPGWFLGYAQAPSGGWDAYLELRTGDEMAEWGPFMWSEPVASLVPLEGGPVGLEGKPRKALELAEKLIASGKVPELQRPEPTLPPGGGAPGRRKLLRAGLALELRGENPATSLWVIDEDGEHGPLGFDRLAQQLAALNEGDRTTLDWLDDALPIVSEVEGWLVDHPTPFRASGEETPR